MKKFVLSHDICQLLKRWGEARGFATPDEIFLARLRGNLKGMLEEIFGAGCVDCISTESMIAGVKRIYESRKIPLVSLDKSYYSTPYRIEFNRSVDESLTDCGVVERFNCPPISEQIKNMKARGLERVILLDDVIFSGDGILFIKEQCRQCGIAVSEVIAGIGIGRGVKKIEEQDIAVNVVFFYEEVIDEVCERDFYPGVPLSGRYISSVTEVETGAPYIFPFGKPCEWASIPSSAAEKFSKFCLGQTIALWEEVERLSKRFVKCSDIERLPLGIYKDGERLVEALRRIIIKNKGL